MENANSEESTNKKAGSTDQSERRKYTEPSEEQNGEPAEIEVLEFAKPATRKENNLSCSDHSADLAKSCIT